MPRSSPWGPIQHQSSVAPGITLVSTAGHGGVHVSERLNRRIHEVWRNGDGWYEQDLEVAIVMVTFPEFFDGRVAAAHERLKNKMPSAYTQATGKEVSPAESVVLRRQAFQAQHHHDFVVHSVVGSGAVYALPGQPTVPIGKVVALARQASTGEERWFVVPKTEYHDGEHGFVIDTAQHTPFLPESPRTHGITGA
jgi:hypothetical protein